MAFDNWLNETLSTWSPIRRYVYGFSLIVTVVFLWWLFSFRHLWRSFSDAQHYVSLKTEYQKEFEVLSEKLAKLKENSSRIKFSSSQLFSTIMKSISTAGLELIKTKTHDIADQIDQGMIEFDLRGSFEKIMIFLENIEQSPYGRMLERCELKRQDDIQIEAKLYFHQPLEQSKTGNKK